MKFFKRYNKNEDQVYDNDVFISVGNSYRSDVLGDMVQNGSFIRISLPFAVTTKYVDAYTFKEQTGKCRPVWLFRKRIVGYHPKPIRTRYFGWIPV